MTLRHLACRLAALLRAHRLDRELDDEIQAHLELAERDALKAGLSPEEARRRARLQFGAADAVREAHRDRRSIRWIENLLKDVRYGLASLGREPLFSLVAIGVLAVGIGANAAMFSLVDAVLLKPIPFPGPDRIVRVWEAPRPGATNATSTLDFLDWRRLGTEFEALAAEQPASAALTGGAEPARLTGRLVTSDYFKVFATGPAIGRTFTPADETPGAPPVVVLSNAAWHTYFGADPGILEKRPVLDGVPHQVIGVLPAGAFDRDGAEFWKALTFTADQRRRDWHWLSVTGRLRDGATLAQARAQMQAIDAALEETTPVWKRQWTIAVEPFDRLLVGDTLRRSILIAFGAVAFVLLIACANLGNLLLARGAARTREMAVRAALGASRGRLASQLLTETFVICLLGGAAGVALSVALVGAATPLLSAWLPFTATVRVDWRVLAFSAAAVAGVTLLAGALPAFQTPAGNLLHALNLSTRTSSVARNGIRRAIVVGEVALSLVLVCGAALLFRSLLNLQAVATGVRMDHVITMSLALPEQAYPTPASAAHAYERLARHAEAAPAVVRAAFSTHLPLQWIGNGEGLFLPGDDEPVRVRLKRVDPGYFDALDIPVLSGRGFTSADRASAPYVVVVNETLARILRDRIGRQQVTGQAARLTSVVGELPVEIVGMIRNERVSSPAREDPPVVYLPVAQYPQREMALIVRTHTEPASVVPAIRAAVRQIDPNLPLGDVATMQQIRARTLSGASRPAWLIGAFAALAAFLAALGLYGVLAQAVVHRRREIGIRMALGAQARDVIAHVLGGALSMVAAGLALGLLGAFAVTRVLENMLFDVSPLDPVALAVACAVMVLIGLLAGFVPASRAAQVHPVAVLREDG